MYTFSHIKSLFLITLKEDSLKGGLLFLKQRKFLLLNYLIHEQLTCQRQRNGIASYVIIEEGLVKLSRSSKNHGVCPSARPQRGCCRDEVHFHGVFQATRENYTLTVLTGDTQHAGHVRICMYTRGLCTQRQLCTGNNVDESSNPCQHRSCRCPRWLQWKFNFPPSTEISAFSETHFCPRITPGRGLRVMG